MNSQQPERQQPVNAQPHESPSFNSDSLDSRTVPSQSAHPTPPAPSETVYGRPVTPAEVAYHDGYVRGRSSEQQDRLREQELIYQQERNSESNAVASGLLMGLIIAAVAGLGALVYFYNTPERRVEPQTNTQTPAGTITQPQKTTIIERTIDRTQAPAPVTVPAPVVIPAPVQVPAPVNQEAQPAPQSPSESASQPSSESPATAPTDNKMMNQTAPPPTQP